MQEAQFAQYHHMPCHGFRQHRAVPDAVPGPVQHHVLECLARCSQALPPKPNAVRRVRPFLFPTLRTIHQRQAVVVEAARGAILQRWGSVPNPSRAIVCLPRATREPVEVCLEVVVPCLLAAPLLDAQRGATAMVGRIVLAPASARAVVREFAQSSDLRVAKLSHVQVQADTQCTDDASQEKHPHGQYYHLPHHGANQGAAAHSRRCRHHVRLRRLHADGQHTQSRRRQGEDLLVRPVPRRRQVQHENGRAD
mmetsp:Transcript_93406/g.267832  ORF Transcript_93406/g.267832 Transcript_93406/m.267832 type:complete len:252 (+) Transcript_93406:349-1104(+)